MKRYYRETAEYFLPHLLSFYDLDPYSPTRGYGDRYFWGWKLKDFNNGIFQGGAYALAIFRQLRCLPNKEKALDVIRYIFEAAGHMQHGNGSVDEAFPYEYAFSVTSTLAFDLLYAYELIEDDISPDERYRYRTMIVRMVNFISKNLETHGFISNHLATAAAAIEKCHRMFDTSNETGKKILDIIMKKQSPDGWYLEYEGPDPGYQTLCTYYLACIWKMTGDGKLLKSLEKSINYLSFFIHPDGTIGGEYGSRNTELYYPGGIEMLAGELPLAKAISNRMYDSISKGNSVSLQSIDPGNFVPLIENHLVAYLSSEKNEILQKVAIPCDLQEVKQYFDDSHVLVRGNSAYYAIVSGAKGGLIKIFDKKNKKIVWDDCGHIGKLVKGPEISTQSYLKQPDCRYSEEDVFFIKTAFYRTLSQAQTPLKLTLLRILNLTIMRNIHIGNLIKNWIIKLLITSKNKYSVVLTRIIEFNANSVIIKDEIVNTTKQQFAWLEYGRKFSTIHMASSKYFQNQYWEETVPPQNINITRLNAENKVNIETRIVLGKGDME